MLMDGRVGCSGVSDGGSVGALVLLKEVLTWECLRGSCTSLLQGSMV